MTYTMTSIAMTSKLAASVRLALCPPGITFILLIGFVFAAAIEIFLCVVGDLNNGCYVLNNDLDCGALLSEATDTIDPARSIPSTTFNSTRVGVRIREQLLLGLDLKVVLTEIKMAIVARIRFDSGVPVATFVSSQTMIVYTNTGIVVPGNFVLRYVFHVINDENDSVYENNSNLMKMSRSEWYKYNTTQKTLQTIATFCEPQKDSLEIVIHVDITNVFAFNRFVVYVSCGFCCFVLVAMGKSGLTITAGYGVVKNRKNTCDEVERQYISTLSFNVDTHTSTEQHSLPQVSKFELSTTELDSHSLNEFYQTRLSTTYNYGAKKNSNLGMESTEDTRKRILLFAQWCFQQEEAEDDDKDKDKDKDINNDDREHSVSVSASPTGGATSGTESSSNRDSNMAFPKRKSKGSSKSPQNSPLDMTAEA